MSASDKKQQRKADLADGLTQRQIKEQAEAKAAKQRKTIYIVVGVVCAVAAAALIIWNNMGIFRYNAVAATVNGVDYKVSDLQYYYMQAQNVEYSLWQQMNSYGVSSGYDPYTPAGQQVYNKDKGTTYADTFREAALETLKETAAICDAAKAEGYTLSEAGQATIDEQFQQIDLICARYNLTRSAYFSQNFGGGVTEKVFRRNFTNDVLASEYQQYHQAQYTYSDEEINDYYSEHSDTLDRYDYRTFFISGQADDPVDDNGDPLVDEEGNTITATEEEKAAAMETAKTKADEAVSKIQAAGDREKTFIELAPEYVAESAKESYSDPSYSLAEQVAGSSLSSNSDIGPWLMDDEREAGDVTAIETSTGYQVVLFLNRYLYENSTVDVRHILIMAEAEDDALTDTNGVKIPSQEAMDAAKAKAQALLDEWKAGDATAESFGELAKKNSDDTGSVNNGGKYTYVAEGRMVPNFNDWIFDPSRQPGDADLVINDGNGGYYGWHVIYFEQPQGPSWEGEAINALRSSDQSAWLDEIKTGYEAVAVDGMKYVGDKNMIPAESNEPAETSAQESKAAE